MHQRRTASDDLLEAHLAANLLLEVDPFLSELDVLVAEPLFCLLLIVDVGCRGVPADDLAAFIFQRIVLRKVPAILPALRQNAYLQVERNSPQKSDPTLIAHPIYIVRMANSRVRLCVERLLWGESHVFTSHPVCVESRPIGRQDEDGLANGIGNRTKFRLTLPQPILGALAVVDVGWRCVPADDLVAFLFQRIVLHKVPAILPALKQGLRPPNRAAIG